MNDHAIDFQNLGLLLLLCFGAALIAAGVALIKTGFLDPRGQKPQKGAPSHSRSVGRLLLIVGAILAFMALMFLLLTGLGAV